MTGLAPPEAEVWLFDLDNTLYPPTSALFTQVDARIAGYIARFLGVDGVEAKRIQKSYFREYGTTLRGLMSRYDIEPVAYMEHVHDIDLSPIGPNPRLERALARLPGRKIVFTNASVPYAERVMERIGIRARFDDIFDIAAAGYVPKPQPAPYRAIVDHYRLDPRRCVMVEDMARNLEPAAALGMTTVWVRNDHEWGAAGRDGPHVHHVADDLAAWLEALPVPET